jgi:hypothetical protein
VVRPARRTLVLVGAYALVSAIIAGVVLYLSSRQQSLPDKLSDWIAEREPSCLGGKPHVERSRPSDRPDLFPDLLPHARSLAVVACDYGGPVTIVLGFASPRDMTRAFAGSTSARGDIWCLKGREAFSGKTLDPGQLPDFCRRLHGAVRPAA